MIAKLENQEHIYEARRKEREAAQAAYDALSPEEKARRYEQETEQIRRDNGIKVPKRKGRISKDEQDQSDTRNDVLQQRMKQLTRDLQDARVAIKEDHEIRLQDREQIRVLKLHREDAEKKVQLKQATIDAQNIEIRELREKNADMIDKKKQTGELIEELKSRLSEAAVEIEALKHQLSQIKTTEKVVVDVPACVDKEWEGYENIIAHQNMTTWPSAKIHVARTVLRVTEPCATEEIKYSDLISSVKRYMPLGQSICRKQICKYLREMIIVSRDNIKGIKFREGWISTSSDSE